MKYTRYDIKRKNSSNLFIFMVILCILVSSVLLGTIFSNLVLKNKPSGAVVNLNDNASTKTNHGNSAVASSSYMIIQFGDFKNKDYAKVLQNTINQKLGNSYMIQNGDSTRLIMGIYNESEGNAAIKRASDKEVETSKKIFQVKSSDLCNSEIAKIIDANLSVIGKLLSDTTIKSIGTDDLKKWTQNLKDVDKNSTNYTVLVNLKKHTSNLPKEMTKDNIEENYSFIYSQLIILK